MDKYVVTSPAIDELTSPTGTEYLNYVIDSTDRKITIDDLAGLMTSNDDLRYSKTALTVSQVENLHATPVELIPAQGTNRVIAIMQVAVTVAAGTAWSGASEQLEIYYNLESDIYMTLDTALTDDNNSSCHIKLQSTPLYVGNNRALYVTQNAAQGALGTGTKIPTFHVFYFVIEI